MNRKQPINEHKNNKPTPPVSEAAQTQVETTFSRHIDSDTMIFEAENAAEKRMLNIQNISTFAAVILFLSARFISALADFKILLTAIAYTLGAIAYLMESMILTDCFTRHHHAKELFMPYALGTLYLILGISYFLQ